MFGQASNQPSLSFGSLNTTQPQQTNSLFGGTSTATSAPSTTPLFGGSLTPAASTTNTLSFGAPANTSTSTTSLFSNSNSLFPTTTTTTSTSVPTTTPSLFVSSTSGQGTTSLFPSNTQQQQQQQQQQQNLLDIKNCFSDTKIPHFFITPDNITRTDVPATAFFGAKPRDLSTKHNDHLDPGSFSSSIAFNKNKRTLPGFLTSTDNTNSSINNGKSTTRDYTGKKRILEDSSKEGRNVLAKNHQGVFAHSNKLTDGFNMNLVKKTDCENVPSSSIRDMNAPVSKYQQDESQFKPLVNNTVIDANQPSNDVQSKTRIRVFGFDQCKTQDIIEYFTQLGDLVEPYASQGNWITFNYVNHASALKALACHGMLFDQDRMVGVTWDERAQEVETLQMHQATRDLFKNPNLFLVKPKPSDSKEQQNGAPVTNNSFFSKVKDMLMGW